MSAADRRAFLAGLAATALPVASLPSAKAEEVTSLATFSDYATATFDAAADATDLAELRSTFDSQFPILALAFKAMTEDSRDLSKTMGDMMPVGGDKDAVAFGLLRHVNDATAWFRDTADVMESASIRMLCGMARAAQERAS